MLDIAPVLAWRGRTVRDRDGEKVGTLGDLYLDDETDRPAYAGVKTGLFGRHETIVPLADAYEEDGDVRVPYELEAIKAAPNVDPDVSLNPEEEERLLGHYGEPTRMRREGAEVTRSQEEVEFRVEPAKPKERIRLRKHTVVENV